MKCCVHSFLIDETVPHQKAYSITKVSNSAEYLIKSAHSNNYWMRRDQKPERSHTQLRSYFVVEACIGSKNYGLINTDVPCLIKKRRNAVQKYINGS